VGRGAAKPLVELLVELLQSFVRSFVQSFRRALVKLNILMFVTCILRVDTARDFFSNQLEASSPTNQKQAWRGFEIQDPKVIDHL
jgi:hypothetical protein